MNHRVNIPKQKHIRKLLRNHPTPWEHKLWGYLKGRQLAGFKFRRQQGIEHYIVDFYCPAAKLIVELDGAGHLRKSAKIDDANRQSILENCGYTVIRFFNNEIDENIEGVLDAIAEKCMELTENNHP